MSGGVKTLTIPNKDGGAGAAELKRAALSLDPLGVMPAVGHLLPESAAVDLVAAAKRPEGGAAPLRGNNTRDGRVVVAQGEPWPFTLLMLETDVECEEDGRRRG